jgi:hypothetical protein
MKNHVHHSEKGVVAILVVLMIAAAGILLATTMSLGGIGGAQSSVSLVQGEQTLDFVEGCAEDALLNVWQNANYAGGNIARPEGTCTVGVSTSTNVYTLTVGTIAASYARTIKVVVTRGATNLILSSWQEI